MGLFSSLGFAGSPDNPLQSNASPAIGDPPRTVPLGPNSASVPVPVADLGVEAAAAQLLDCTVTVRMLPPRELVEQVLNNSRQSRSRNNADNAATVDNPQKAPLNQADVIISSGISLGKGLIVMFRPSDVKAPLEQRFRVTLPDGQQQAAELRVVDNYSGLGLLRIENENLFACPLAEQSPKVGSTVLTASAAGIERPLVSQGIVSGVDRSLSGSELPPLLQCDIRSTDNSSGAAVVDKSGRLLGVVAATAPLGQAGGWAYAVPSRHVRRLLDAESREKLVVLERRRPTVGLTMRQGAKEGVVEVERVEKGGPADLAGIVAGDLISEANGRKIRSAYQAVDMILSRQPGECVEFVVEHESQRKNVAVTLGCAPGRLAPPAAHNYEAGGAYVGPQVKIRAFDNNTVEISNNAVTAEADAKLDATRGASLSPRRVATDEATLLRRQLSAFEQVIRELQADIERRKESETASAERIRSLEARMEALRQELARQPSGTAGSGAGARSAPAASRSETPRAGDATKSSAAPAVDATHP